MLEARRPDRFVFRWKVDNGSNKTTVEINFEPVHEGAVVRLIEYGYEDTPTGMKDLLNCVSGWGEVLTMMKFYLEHGVTF